MYQKSSVTFNRGTFGENIMDELPMVGGGVIAVLPSLPPPPPRSTRFIQPPLTILRCEVHGVFGWGLRRRTPFGGVVVTCPICDDKMIWTGGDTIRHEELTAEEQKMASKRIREV